MKKNKTIKYRMRAGSQWFLIGLMTTSTFLPGITATVSASTRENTISQNSDISQSENNEGIDTDQDKDVEKIIEDEDNIKSLAVMHEDEKDTDNLAVYKNTDILNDDTDIEKSLKEPDAIDLGIIGSANWRIDSTGTLHISEGDMGIGSVAGKWAEYASEIKKISFDGKILAAKNLSELFWGLNQVTEIEHLSNLDTTKVTKMRGLFSGMSSLTSLDLSNFDTSNVTDMSSMFLGASSLTSLDLSNFDTSNVTTMSSMFSGMSSLNDLNISNFNTTKVTDMYGMFLGPSSLKELDLSHFDTSNVSYMHNMFANQSSLLKLDVSSFRTPNLITSSSMFLGDSALEKLDLSGFETSNETIMSGMFRGMSNLSQVKLGGSFTFAEGSAFPGPGKSTEYTGNWINVATGTVDSPLGANIWSPTEMMANYNPKTDADTYVWERRVAAEDVTVRYVDSQGDEIRPSQNISGNIGDDYDASTSAYKLIIDGYTLDESKLPENATGTFSDQPQEVVYVYEIEKNQSSIIVHDSELAVGDVWTAEDNFDKATDYYGNNILFSEIGVTGEVDTSKVGTYKVTYNRFIPNFLNSTENQGIYSAIATITVKDKQTAVNVHDSTLYVGDNWQAEDNFDSALDKDGKAVDFKDVKVSGNVDTTKSGSYEITYSYDGLEETATVTVLEIEVGQDLAHIVVHDSELKVGDDWSPQDNFDKATSSDGKEVNFSDVVVSGAVNTKKPGIYEVTYSIPEEYWGRDIVEGQHTATAKIVVSEDKGNDDRDSNSKGEDSDYDQDNSSSTDHTSGKNDFQNNKGLPKTGEHTSALIFMMGMTFLVLGSIFSVLRIKKNKK